MSKHPLARRARSLASRTHGRRDAYGDGMFFFTRPVGAPVNYPEGQGENRNMDPRGAFAVTTGYTSGGEFLGDYYADGANTRPGGYGDGAFYFLQKVGQPAGGYGDVAMQAPTEPPVVRMGFAGIINTDYGVATPSVPGIRGVDVRSTRTRSDVGAGRGGRATSASVADPATIAAFEKAGDDYGRAKFWYGVWGDNQRKKVGDISRAEFRKRSDQWNAARRAYETAKTALLAGTDATFDSRGLGTNALGKAFNSYELALIDNGYYAEAYRNVATSGKRTHAGSVFDAMRQDLAGPLKGDYRSMTLDEAIDIAREYLFSDAQSRMVDPNDDPGGKATDVKDIWGKEALKYVDKTDYDAVSRAMRPIQQLTGAIFTDDFRAKYKRKRNDQDRARAGLAQYYINSKSTFEDLRKTAVAQAAAQANLTAVKDTIARAGQSAKNAEDAALTKSTEAETKALGFDVAGTEAAAAAAGQFAATADTSAKQAEAAASSAAADLRTMGASGAADKRDIEQGAAQARRSATNAAQYAQSAVARIEAAKAGKKAAEDKAAADAAATTAATAQQAVDAAQRNLDAVKARLAQGQATQADVDAAQRALDEANARLTAAKAEADRLAQTAQASAANAQSLNERADDLGTKVPEGAVQPRGKGPMRKVGGGDTEQAGGEGFFSKYSTELIIGGAILAIGGYFAWQKYGKK